MRSNRKCLRMLVCVLAVAMLGVTLAPAQDAPARQKKAGMRFQQGPVSPEVHADRTVTFRLRAPKAAEVSVSGEIGAAGKMTKDDKGVWSVTVGPLAPNIYDYGFNVDGLRILDVANPDFKNPTTSMLLVPGEQTRPYELRKVAHGNLTIHWYDSKAAGVTRRIIVYTPPGYGKGDEKYPVLYLLHGSGGNESSWSAGGKANLILDNLLEGGKAKPAVIVMPNGHVSRPAATAGAAEMTAERNRTMSVFENDLLGDVMPLVEANYRVYTDPAHRAIAGLSMGGGQSATIGLNHPELFGFVGVWSMGAREPDTQFKKLVEQKPLSDKNLKLLWIGCGKSDGFFAGAEEMDQWMTAHQVKHVWRPSEGSHQWPVWRMYLSEFLPLLFKAE